MAFAKFHFRVIAGAALALALTPALAWTGPLAGEAGVEAPVQPVAPAGPERPSKAGELAARAAAAEMAGKPREAAELFAQAAAGMAEDAAAAEKRGEAGRAEAAAAWAEAEYLMEKGCALAERAAARRLLPVPLRALLKAAGDRPALADLATWRLGEALCAAGDSRQAAREFARLGFVTDWQVIGPFDNERGQGFETAYPPETGLDLAARHPGKKREVGWRPAAAAAPDGYVDLGGMLRPDRDAAAYLLTCVEVRGRTELPVAVRAGSSGGLRVWLNGREVWKRDVHRPPGFDQDCFGATLRPGRNCLLVKSTHSEGDWGLRLRLTRPAGGPLEGLRFRAEAPREPLRPAEGAPPAVERGAAGFFEARSAAAPQDADALLRLAWLVSRAAAFDHEVGARPDRELLQRAAAARPADARIWYELSMVSAFGGRLQAETDENPRRAALEKSVAAAPGAAAELELAGYYLRRYRNFARAVGHLNRARALGPDSPELELLEIELSEARGDRAEAAAAAARLAKAAPEEARAQAAHARLLAACGAPAEASERYDAALKLDAGEALMAEACAAHEASGQAFKSLEVLEELLRRRPCAAAPRLERARILAGRGDFEAALAECRAGLQAAPEDHRLLARQAECLESAGRGGEAAAARARALEVMPNFVELERYVEYLEGRPGYDRRHRENTEELLAAAAGASFEGGEAGAFLLDKVIDRVYPDGTSSRTVHVLVRVLSDHGARMFASQNVFYVPGEQRAAVRTARVFRAGGGSENARVHPERRLPRGEGEVAVRTVEFPAPAPGDTVELEYRVDDLEQGFFGRYFGTTFHFRRDLPVLRSRYVLIAPKDLAVHFRTVRCSLQPEVSEDPREAAVIRTWTAADGGKVAREPMMASLREAAPALEVSTYRDWGSFGRWYWGLIRKQYEPGPLIRRKSAELCAGAATEMDRIRAVYNFVVTDIRYVAWEFGVHGFKPYRAEQVLSRRFGDCKDKAALICALLAEQGIAARPALVRSQELRERQDLELPLIGHFNHCIVHVPATGDRPELWLDGTAANASLDALPDQVRGAPAAVIAPEGAAIRQVPAAAPENNTTSDRFVLTVQADGSAGGLVRSSATGNRSVTIRRHFRNPPVRVPILDRLHGRRNPGASTGAVGFSDLGDLRVPVSFEYSLMLPVLARERSGGLELELPDDPLRGAFVQLGAGDPFPPNLTVYCPGGPRRHDLVLGSAWSHTAAYEITLPPGWRPAELPPDAAVETDFGRLKVSRRFADGRLVVEKHVALAVTRVPAARYAEFRKFCRDVDRLESVPVHLLRPESPPPAPGAGGGRP